MGVSLFHSRSYGDLLAFSCEKPKGFDCWGEVSLEKSFARRTDFDSDLCVETARIIVTKEGRDIFRITRHIYDTQFSVWPKVTIAVSLLAELEVWFQAEKTALLAKEATEKLARVEKPFSFPPLVLDEYGNDLLDGE